MGGWGILGIEVFQGKAFCWLVFVGAWRSPRRVCQAGWWSRAPTSRSAARPTVRATEHQASPSTVATATTATSPARPPVCHVSTACCCSCRSSSSAFSNRPLWCSAHSLSLASSPVQQTHARAWRARTGSDEITGPDHFSADFTCVSGLRCFSKACCAADVFVAKYGTESSTSWGVLIRHSYLSVRLLRSWEWLFRGGTTQQNSNNLLVLGRSIWAAHTGVQVVLQIWC